MSMMSAMNGAWNEDEEYEEGNEEVDGAGSQHSGSIHSVVAEPESGDEVAEDSDLESESDYEEDEEDLEEAIVAAAVIATTSTTGMFPAGGQMFNHTITAGNVTNIGGSSTNWTSVASTATGSSERGLPTAVVSTAATTAPIQEKDARTELNEFFRFNGITANNMYMVYAKTLLGWTRLCNQTDNTTANFRKIKDFFQQNYDGTIPNATSFSAFDFYIPQN